MTDKTYQTTLLIRGDHKNAVRSVELTRGELEKLTGSQRAGVTATDRFTAAFGRANSSVEKATRNFGGFQAIIGALGIGKLVSETIQASNTYASLQGQLALVTDSQEELNSTYEQALLLANETGSSTEATVNLYARLARSTEQLDVSQNDLLTVTKAVNQSFVVSGASAQEAASSTLQFSQGLASGVLRGEELNSVMENSPRLAKAIADALGVTIGQLREMGKEGELSTERLVQALLDSADSIESDFQRMPVTIGRVWQTVVNDTNDALGRVDTSNLIGSLEELRATVASPEFKEGISAITGALLNMVGAGAQAMSTAAGLAKFLGEELAAAVAGPAMDDIPRLEERVEDLTDALEKNLGLAPLFRMFGFETTAAQKDLAKQLVVAKKALDDARKAQEEYAVAQSISAKGTKGQADATSQLTEIEVKAQRIKSALTKDQIASIDAYEKGRREVRGMISDLEFEISTIGQEQRAIALATAERELSSAATEEERERILELIGAKYDAIAANEAQAEADKERAKVAADAAQEIAKANEDAARETERAWMEARGVLSDFFFEFARDGQDAFDTLTDGFSAMLAKMIAEAAANQILIGIGTVAGGAGFPGIANAALQAGGGSDILSLLSGAKSGGSLLSGGLNGALTGGFESLSQLYQGAGNFLTDIGLESFGNALGDAGVSQFSNASNLTNLSNLGLNLAGGFAGSYLGGEVFGGDTTGIGSAAGGFTGNALPLPPGVGAAIGSFIGEGLETGLGNLLGFGSGGNNAAIASFTDGEFTSEGLGKNFSERNLGAVTDLASVISAFAATLGGADFDGQLKVGNKAGIKFKGPDDAEGQQFKDAAAFLEFGFNQVINAADGLDADLKELLLTFDGNAEETLNYAQALVTVDKATEGLDESVRQMALDFDGSSEEMVAYANTLAMAGQITEGLDGSLRAMVFGLQGSNDEILRFAASITALEQQSGINAATQAIEDFRRVTPSLMTAYDDQSSGLRRMIRSYDGSVEATEEITGALAANKAIAYEFALSIQAIGEQLSDASKDQAAYIRESVMSSEALREQRTQERDSLREALDSLTDPQEVEASAKRILGLNRQIFDSLEENDKKRRSETFAAFAEETNSAAQEILSAALSNAEKTQGDINSMVQTMLTDSAQQFQRAADSQMLAAQMQVQAAEIVAQALNNLPAQQAFSAAQEVG